MPPKRLFQSQLKKKAANSSSPPLPPPLQSSEVTLTSASAPALSMGEASLCSSGAATNSAPEMPSASPSTPATTIAPTPSPTVTAPVPPPLLAVTAYEGQPEAQATMAVVIASQSPSTSEAPRSIRSHNKDGKAPVNPRKITSAKTTHMVKATGSKLKVEFSPFHKGPGQKDRYDSYVRDLGAGVREVVTMLANTWSSLQPEHRSPLTDYMEMYYDVPSTPEMELFFKKKTSSLYKE